MKSKIFSSFKNKKSRVPTLVLIVEESYISKFSAAAVSKSRPFVDCRDIIARPVCFLIYQVELWGAIFEGSLIKGSESWYRCCQNASFERVILFPEGHCGILNKGPSETGCWNLILSFYHQHDFGHHQSFSVDAAQSLFAEHLWAVKKRVWENSGFRVGA